MKIIDASFEIVPRGESRGGMANIVMAGRTCYKSVADGDPELFVRNLIKRGHDSVLEHGDMIFEVERGVFELLEDELNYIRRHGDWVPHLELTDFGGKRIVSGNIRAWRELFKFSWIASPEYFIDYFDDVYMDGCRDGHHAAPDHVKPISATDLTDQERWAHWRQTVRFIIDRGVSHEFVRHRAFSFSQESQRFCSYNADRFDGQVTFIEPCYLADGTDEKLFWKQAASDSSRWYFAMLDAGATAQEARAVLINSTKTELIMTGNLRAWNHFFDLRARQVTGSAHPQAVEVAEPLYNAFRSLFPDIIV